MIKRKLLRGAVKLKRTALKAKPHAMKAASHVKKHKAVYGGAAAGAGGVSIYKAGKRKGKSMRGRPRKRRM